MPRVNTEKLARTHELLFGSKRYAGSQVAERLGVKHVTLWSWICRRGMPRDEAVRLANDMMRHATDMIAASQELRAAADAAV
jgi:uncharacterized protein YjcR